MAKNSTFDEIDISTQTIIAKTNWKVDIFLLFNHLPITFYKKKIQNVFLEIV